MGDWTARAASRSVHRRSAGSSQLKTWWPRAATPAPSAVTALPSATGADTAPGTSPVAAAPVSGEQSYVGRIVAICTPVFVLVAGAIAGAVGHAIPGLQLDQSQIVALMVAVAGSALTAGWKWLQGWQQHEQNVADGKVEALRKK